MSLFRGTGGPATSDDNATVSTVTELAQTATTKANEASASADAAASSSSSASSSASAASTSESNASSSATSANQAKTAAQAAQTAAESAQEAAETAESNAEAAVVGALQASNNLSDLDNTTTARSNLGLGTVATTDASAYATSAQGSLADSAVQPNDNISTLTNDSGFITDYTVTESDVTTHEAALSITESQISDLQSYLTSASSLNAANLTGTLDGGTY